MMIRPLRVLLILVLLSPIARAQPLKPGEWKSYTSMRSVQDIALSSDSNMIWVATSGGAFRIDLRNGNGVTAYRTTDGLTENDIASICTDRAGNVYFGERSGGFDVLRASTGTVQRRLEIRNQEGLTDRTINNLYASGDRIYLATAFGLSIYNPTGNGFFVTTVNRIGDLPQADSVLDVVESNGRLYLAMNEGIASAPLSAELTIPNVWTRARFNAHPSSIIEFRGALIVGTDSGVFRFAGADTLVRIDGFGSAAVVGLVARRDSLLVLTSDGVLHVSSDLQGIRTENIASEIGATPAALSATYDGFALVGTQERGIYFGSPRGFDQHFFPEGPVANEVTDLIFVSEKNQLYSSHSKLGLSAFSPLAGDWFDYAAGGEVPQRQYERLVFDGVRDVVWASTFGGGIYKVHNFGSEQITYDWITEQNGLQPQVTGSFIVAGDGIIDRDGRYCVANWAASGRGLVITSDGSTFSASPLAPASDQGISWGSVTQDHEGNYWVATQHSEPLARGLFWSRRRDQAYGSILGGPGLQIENRNINAVLTDQDDGIWLGTDAGVQILSNPYAIEQSNPTFYFRSVKLLDQQVVHAIAVDGVGNKWVATERGIFVVSPDGTDSVAHFSTENSPLIDDRVQAITIDQERGEVYAGTPSGISRFSTIFTGGKADYSGIRVYPNPLVQTSESSPEVTIDGLVAGSTVKVFTLNGKLVASINGTNLGSTVKWDGRDSMGHVVTSGLYLITATSQSSGDNGEAKLVIVRH